MDECHLLWGDACGYIWGPPHQRVEVPIENSRRRQTYYGAVDIYSGQFYLRPYERANGHYTVTFLRYLQRLYPDQQLVIFWDGATYHRYGERIDFLQQVNQGLAEHQWKVTCILLAPHAPQENPVEDVWLKAKTFVPQHFHVATSFKKVKQLFVRAIESEPYFDFPKLDQYMISCT